jgi:23S rRNA (uracil1939-C5)-methyltransferase
MHDLQPATPRCPHFGACGGCQYQDITHASQISLKRDRLSELLTGLSVPEIQVHASEPYGYRNRIRLRVERVDGILRFGYNVRATTEFLPITTCPIAAPALWNTAEAILAVAAQHEPTALWLGNTTELELFTNDDLSKLQLTFLCPPRTNLPQGFFARMMAAITEAIPVVVGASAVALDARIGLTGRTLETFGAPGLNYTVAVSTEEAETYWISRGGFFQINRFLLPTLVEIVTAKRTGALAWDLFAGVGLFSRVLARNFTSITAVESGPTAALDLTNSFKKLGPEYRAVQATTLDFLRPALLDRDRPDLIVLDPPRAGAGVEACELIARIAPREIVYVSCDPTTLARDWAVLEQHGYRATETHLVDLFPQTTHLETVVAFQRAS